MATQRGACVPRPGGHLLSLRRTDALGRGSHRTNRYRQATRQAWPRAPASSRTTTADGPGSAPASLRLSRTPRASGEFGPSELEAEVHPTTTPPTGIAYPLGRRRGPELVAEPSLLLPGCQQPLTPPAWLGDLPSPLSETAVRSSYAPIVRRRATSASCDPHSAV